MINPIIYNSVRAEQTYALISVIVPAYNVEKYLARCLNSILAQTYTNLEILIIDDGSTDSTGTISDQYALRDPRIRVIHQENQGLAEVRNVGLREARGEYIQFVDSDDWIDPETIETCYKYLHEYDADIVSFCFIHEYENGKRYHPAEIHSPELMSGAKSLSLIFFQGSIHVASWNKLFRADLFDGVAFPAGRLHEDIYTIYKVLARAEKVLSVSDEFYHYFHRQGSITAVFSERTYDFASSAQECFDFSMKLNPDDKTARINLLTGLLCCKMEVANYMIKANDYDMDYISQVQKEIEPLTVLRCRHIRPFKKAQLVIFKYSLRLYRLLYMKFKRF
ncbi:MAG: glycosyltransferase family 2 protein [Synergistaceae bacterium]|nr:glycosyltransferase family 2 protein [Synergistaceae bacterium]